MIIIYVSGYYFFKLKLRVSDFISNLFEVHFIHSFMNILTIFCKIRFENEDCDLSTCMNKDTSERK